MEAQVSIKSGESYHISGSATRGESYRISGSVTRGESYRISGSFNNKGLAQNLKEFWASFLQKNTRGYETSRSWCISSGLLNEKQGAGSKPNPYILITYYLLNFPT